MSKNKKLESSLEGLFSKPRGKTTTLETPAEYIPTHPSTEANKSSAESGKGENTPLTSQPASSPSGEIISDSRPKPPARGFSPSKPSAKIGPKTPVDETKPLSANNNAPDNSDPTPPQPFVTPEAGIFFTDDKAVAEVKPEPSSDTSPEKFAPAASSLEITHMEEGKQVLIFRMQDVDYGIEVGAVQTIIKPQSVFLVPGTEEYIKGLINLRGDVVPVVDLRSRFSLPEKKADKDTRFVVIEIGDLMASLVVDAVQGVATIPLSAIEEPNALVADIETRYLNGIAHLEDQLVLILDLRQTIRA